MKDAKAEKIVMDISDQLAISDAFKLVIQTTGEDGNPREIVMQSVNYVDLTWIDAGVMH